MDSTLALVCGLTFVIHLIDTLAYSVRIAGVRTRRLAVSLSLFNLFILVSRTANSVQAPLLAKRVEAKIATGAGGLPHDLRLVLIAGSLATLLGAFLIPTFQAAFSKVVRGFDIHRSIPRLLMHGFSKAGLSHFRDSMKAPDAAALLDLPRSSRLPTHILILNAFAVGAWTVAVLAALYAGYLNPSLRVTAVSLSAVISGVATIMLYVFSDPYLSALTDDVMAGRANEAFFRRSVVWLVGSRFAGTIIAQAMLKPAALAIGVLARHI